MRDDPDAPVNDPSDDQALVERARRDPEAFGALFDRHFEAVFGYVYRRTGEWDDARDLTSEVFLKALRGLWRFRWTGVPFIAWLLAIANNELRMYCRRGKRAPVRLDTATERTVDVPDPATLEAERAAAEAEQERAIEFARVRRALLLLPAKYQEVIALRFFEKKSTADVARILGTREGTVKSLLSRGVARLRVALRATDSKDEH